MSSDAQTASYCYNDNTRGFRACTVSRINTNEKGANCARGNTTGAKLVITYRKPMAVPRTGPKPRNRIGTHTNSNMPAHLQETALSMSLQGLLDSEIHEFTGISVSTLKRWRRWPGQLPISHGVVPFCIARENNK